MNILEMTMPAYAQAIAAHRTVILPCGALEEHGPHLPLGTDTLHALEVARRTARRQSVLVAPPLYYGLCRSTLDHPGTISVSWETIKNLVVELGLEFHRQGMRHFLVLTGHAGGAHVGALVAAGEKLLTQLPDINVAVVNLLDVLAEIIKLEPDLVQTRGDAHAGEVETGIMQAVHPELVKGTAPAEWPQFPKFILVRRKLPYWPGGVWGDPGAASSDRGEALLEREADFLAQLLRQILGFRDL